MSRVADFLRGKTLLITGSTGFLAKGLVEKILWEVPEVRRLYLLIRPRKRPDRTVLSPEERLEREVFQSSAFGRLRARYGEEFQPFVRERVRAFGGNLTMDGLGLDPDTRARLAAEVQIVIHTAATVVFDEPLDQALALNTLGPMRLVEFAKSCRDPIFLHVSTAYVAGRQTGRVEETPIPPKQTVAHRLGQGCPDYSLEREVEDIIAFTRRLEEDSWRPEVQEDLRRSIRKENGRTIPTKRMERLMDASRKRWLNHRLIEEGMGRARRLGWLDAYTLTKAMGEQAVVQARGDMPTVIVRPSIIESSLLEPEPGWLEDLKVADTLIVHYSKGRLTDFPANPDIVLDLIPVDVVVNAILAALPGAREGREVKIYHVATGTENPLKLGEMFRLVHEYFLKNPVRTPKGEPVPVQRWSFPSPAKFRLRHRLKYQIPIGMLQWMIENLSVVPWSRRLRRKVSTLEATTERVLSLAEIYSPYTNLDFRFETKNTRSLYLGLSLEDQRIFNFDVARIDWREYIQDIHISGLRRHVLKDNPGPDVG